MGGKIEGYYSYQFLVWLSYKRKTYFLFASSTSHISLWFLTYIFIGPQKEGLLCTAKGTLLSIRPHYFIAIIDLVHASLIFWDIGFILENDFIIYYFLFFNLFFWFLLDIEFKKILKIFKFYDLKLNIDVKYIKMSFDLIILNILYEIKDYQKKKCILLRD